MVFCNLKIGARGTNYQVFENMKIKNLIFGESSNIVIDPVDEKLKSEFAEVTTSLIPMQSIIRIDQVKKRGKNKILDIDKTSTVTAFPTTKTTND